jgi:hypothetical protein
MILINSRLEELGPGWIIVGVPLSEFRKNVELERLSWLLDRTLTMGLGARPNVRVRAAFLIVEDGFTTA